MIMMNDGHTKQITFPQVVANQFMPLFLGKHELPQAKTFYCTAYKDHFTISGAQTFSLEDGWREDRRFYLQVSLTGEAKIFHSIEAWQGEIRYSRYSRSYQVMVHSMVMMFFWKFLHQCPANDHEASLTYPPLDYEQAS